MLVIFGFGLLAVLALMTLLWLVSLRLHDVSIVDIFWGPAFALAAWVYVWAEAARGGACVLEAPWRLLPLVLVTVWGLRLAIHIARRHGGEDRRYRQMREKRGPSFRWWSLFGVFWLQAVLASVISLPLLVVLVAPRPERFTGLDALAAAVWLVGFAFEAVGDWQLTRFKADPASRGRVLSSGLWRYTRHPNYFGDACLWWGFALFAGNAESGLYIGLSIFSATLMTFFLLKVSGVALLEKDIAERRPKYRDYIERTPAFFPWWPKKKDS